MELSIIIVNWNSAQYVRKCLSSVLESTKEVSFEIIVVDNASYDGSDAIVQEEYSDVVFIQNEKNVGFAGANNIGASRSRGRSLLFLNPDTEVLNDAIDVMVANLNKLPNAGVVGCKLLNSDLTTQNTSVRVFPNILNQVLDSQHLMRLFPRSMLWGTAPLYNQSGSSFEVEAVSGAGLMIKRSVFESIGMFSTDYFMYSEDIDLCYMARKAGWRTYFLPDAKIIHHGGCSSSQTGVSAFTSVMMAESRSKFFRKSRSKSYSRFYRSTMFLISIVRLAIMVSILPVLWVRGNTNSFKIGFRKWSGVLRWALGFENWAHK